MKKKAKPKVRKMRVRLDKKRQDRFIELLRATGSVRRASRECGIEWSWAYKLRKTDTDFAKRWEDALEDAIDALEQEARRRSIEGVPEPVFYKGVPVGAIKRYSDRLLELMLKAHLPHQYGDRRIITGENGGPVQTTAKVIVVPAKAASVEEWTKMAQAALTEDDE